MASSSTDLNPTTLAALVRGVERELVRALRLRVEELLQPEIDDIVGKVLAEFKVQMETHNSSFSIETILKVLVERKQPGSEKELP